MLAKLSTRPGTAWLTDKGPHGLGFRVWGLGFSPSAPAWPNRKLEFMDGSPQLLLERSRDFICRL